MKFRLIPFISSDNISVIDNMNNCYNYKAFIRKSLSIIKKAIIISETDLQNGKVIIIDIWM